MSFQTIKAVASAGTPAGWEPFTLVGSTMTTALSDSSDATYIVAHGALVSLSRELAYVVFANPAVPSGAVIEWVSPMLRERHGVVGGYLTAAEIHATSTAGQHKTSWSLAQTGTNPADGVFYTSMGPLHLKAGDGKEWSDCDQDSFTAVIAWGPNWFDASVVAAPYPQAAKIELVVSYRRPPTVTISSPSGVVADPRTTVVWQTIETGVAAEANPSLNTQQEAYRLIVVPSGTLDGASVAAGAAGFNPETAVTVSHDSAKTYSAVTTARVTTQLSPGTSYWFYVKAWQPPVGSREMTSAWTGVGPYTVTTAFTVADPTVNATQVTNSSSVLVTITASVVGGGETAPSFYQLQKRVNGLWRDVENYTRLTGAGPWNFTDSASGAGPTSYRARGVYIASATLDVPSPWVSANLTVNAVYAWWLKDPTNPTLDMVIDVIEHAETIPKPQEVVYPAGATTATVTHQGVRAGVHRVRIRTTNATAYNGLRALLDSGRTLVLTSVFGDAWRVQAADGAEVSIVRAQPTVGELTPIRALRVITVTFTEVD